MDINATLIGQMITFALFVLITMKWIWPLFKQILDERAKKIADGLAAAAQGNRQLAIAEQQAQEIVQQAKERAAQIIAESNQRAHSLIEQAKQKVHSDADRILANGQAEIAREVQLARESLRHEIGLLALLNTEKILQRQVTAHDTEKLLAEIAGEL